MHRFSAHVSALATALGLLAATAEGCNDEPPVERRLCQRFDACNFFVAGIDVDDCTDIMTMCTEGLVSSLHRDWTRAADDALANDNCVNFIEAYANVDVCWIDDDATIHEQADTGASTECDGGDTFECSGADQISGCFDGESFVFECWDVCDDDGLVSGGCGFSDDKGHDACFCEAGTATASESGSDGTTTIDWPETTSIGPDESDESGPETTSPGDSSTGGEEGGTTATGGPTPP